MASTCLFGDKTAKRINSVMKIFVIVRYHLRKTSGLEVVYCVGIKLNLSGMHFQHCRFRWPRRRMLTLIYMLRHFNTFDALPK